MVRNQGLEKQALLFEKDNATSKALVVKSNGPGSKSPNNRQVGCVHSTNIHVSGDNDSPRSCDVSKMPSIQPGTYCARNPGTPDGSYRCHQPVAVLSKGTVTRLHETRLGDSLCASALSPTGMQPCIITPCDVSFHGSA